MVRRGFCEETVPFLTGTASLGLGLGNRQRSPRVTSMKPPAREAKAPGEGPSWASFTPAHACGSADSEFTGLARGTKKHPSVHPPGLQTAGHRVPPIACTGPVLHLFSAVPHLTSPPLCPAPFPHSSPVLHGVPAYHLSRSPSRAPPPFSSWPRPRARPSRAHAPLSRPIPLQRDPPFSSPAYWRGRCRAY